MMQSNKRLLQWIFIVTAVLGFGLVALLWEGTTERLAQFDTLRKADEFVQKKQTPQAEMLLKDALHHWPNEAMFHLKLAYLYHQKKEYSKAQAHYEKGLALHPTAYTFRHHYARLLQQLRKPNEAISMYRLILKAHPNHVASVLDLAELYRFTGNRADALGFDKERDRLWNLSKDYYTFSIRLNSSLPKAWYGLADLLYRDGQYQAAKASYCQVLHSLPHYEAAWFNLGLNDWYLGNTQNGMMLMNYALQMPVEGKLRKAQQNTMYALRQHYYLLHKKNIALPHVDDEELQAFMGLQTSWGQYIEDEYLPKPLLATCAPWVPPVLEPPNTH
jgi:tetratricopeptide (TPR) repeat protein